MSDQPVEQQDVETPVEQEGGGGGDTPVVEQGGGGEQGFAITEDQWNTVVGALIHLSRGREEAPVEDDDFDPEDADIPQLVERYFDGRFKEVAPLIEAAAEKAGRDRLDELFNQAEKDPKIGSFDRNLAEKAAHSFFNQYGGDPRFAQQAALEGAKFAAEVRRQERSAGVEEYKKSVSGGGFEDPSIVGGGVRAAKKFDSQDDVIDFYEKTYGKGADEVG